MPRIKIGVEHSLTTLPPNYVEQLADALKQDRAGQPFIIERDLTPNKIRVLVIWDEWKELTLEQRTQIIRRAYEKAESAEYVAKIALMSGVTFPEATNAGMLPYKVVPLLRKTDSIKLQECEQAMREEGASDLLGKHSPQLRFPTEQSAEVVRQNLIARLPESAEVWAIVKDATSLEEFEE